jgi:phosphoribosylformylglycinamidine synthase subunit PurQ / glutaminase
MVRVLVIRTAGTNCDAEMVRGFEMAGGKVDLVHVDVLAADPEKIDQAQMIGFPGGFSYGDDIASGRILAMTLRERLWPALRAAADRGVPMLGACNGFQVMVQLGLLPGVEAQGSDQPPRPTLALAQNADGRFVDRWTHIEVPDASVCIWTAPWRDGFEADELMLPSAHGEGRLVAANSGVLDDLEARGQVAVRYVENFNGSERAIAGICDPTGRIFGLMPHPERYLDWNRHPFWTRLERCDGRDTPGLAMFRAAVEAATRTPA